MPRKVGSQHAQLQHRGLLGERCPIVSCFVTAWILFLYILLPIISTGYDIVALILEQGNIAKNKSDQASKVTKLI